MKKYFLTALILSSFLDLGCGGIIIDENFEKITTPVTSQQLLGTYTFKPDTLQAKRIGIKPAENIILKITNEEVGRFKSDSSTSYGKYYINKMILVTNAESDKPYNGVWMFFSLKDNVPSRNEYINDISFKQHIIKGNNISFEIGKDKNDILHIVGYTSDPRYEVIKIIDFKKVK